MIYINHSDGTVGVITHGELALLPDQIRETIMKRAESVKETDDGLEFFIRDEILADNIYQEITHYQKQNLDTSMSLNRPPIFEVDGAQVEEEPAEAETTDVQAPEIEEQRFDQVPGSFTDEDIDRLFDIQKGHCYYTGKLLKRDPVNFVVDLIEPAEEGGSCWPGNLALVLKEVSEEKGSDTKMKYFVHLQKIFGEDWYQKQREYCRDVDLNRRVLDKHRKDSVVRVMEEMQSRLSEQHPSFDIRYWLDSGQPVLLVGSYRLDFPPEYLRDRKKFDSYPYIANLVSALIG